MHNRPHEKYRIVCGSGHRRDRWLLCLLVVARLGRSPAWAAAGVGALIVFAWLLTRIDMNFAGRAYAAYGGIYIAAALLWLWCVEGARPDRWDAIGVGICLLGATVIVFGPRSA